MNPPKFVGSHGEDWCVRPAQLGPPDHVNHGVLHWLIVPGPPMSCYLAVVPALPNPMDHSYYHMHPETWSIHVVLSGIGRHYIDDKGHDIGPGTVIYQGPGVRHSIHPNPGQTLTHLSIQYPAAGYEEKSWVICPEAGTVDHFGKVEAFLERFGVLDKFVEEAASKEIFTGPRWSEYIKKKRTPAP